MRTNPKSPVAMEDLVIALVESGDIALAARIARALLGARPSSTIR